MIYLLINDISGLAVFTWQRKIVKSYDLSHKCGIKDLASCFFACYRCQNQSFGENTENYSLYHSHKKMYLS